MRALIIGGGVGGPAVAQFLHRAGWDVEIFEAQERPAAYGGLFLNVGTNGLAVLEQLGLARRLVADGHRAPHMVMWSGRGKKLGTVPNGPAREPERGSVVVTRRRLHEVVREGTEEAGIPMTFGARLTGITETADGVEARFADGRTATGDILIGADGIGSPTRTHIDPDAVQPHYSGLVGLGGFAQVPGLGPTPETQHLVFGARAFFGYLVRTDGTVYWFANLTRPEPERGSLRDVPAEEWLAELRDLYSDDPYPVPQILAHADLEVGAYPIYDLSGVRHWSRGRVVAIGDAVHATSPSTGQGASQALEDAITLAKALRDAPDYATAFAEYQRVRQPRVERIVQYARVIDSRKRVTKSRVGVAIRDAFMPKFLAKAADDTRNDWLYNHTVAWTDQAPADPDGRTS